MKDYAKVGGKPGKPGYRTPRSFLNKFVGVFQKNSRRNFYNKTKIKIRGYFAGKSENEEK